MRDAQPGLVDSVQSLAATAVRGVHTRLELAAVEFESERDRLLQRLALMLLALLCAAFGMVLGVLWLMMFVDPAHRTTTLGVVSLVFLVAAGVAALAVRALARAGFMSTTLAVLADDARALAGGHTPARARPPVSAGAVDA